MRISHVRLSWLLSPLLLLAIYSAALADWPNANPTKWVQLPDRNPTGMDVLATVPKILADDFLCTFSGPITDIHIWGSWLNDQFPGDPGNLAFKLSFHSDIPATPTDHSRPGTLLWEKFFNPGDPLVVVRQDGSGQESFYDPNTDQIIGTDTQIWQYNFTIPLPEAFVQQQGNIYWLDVQAAVPQPGFLFGWKTSLDHFNDDAVWGDAPFGGIPPEWNELRYPAGHPFQGQSIDLAFALTTVPEPSSMVLLLLGFVGLGARQIRLSCRQAA